VRKPEPASQPLATPLTRTIVNQYNIDTLLDMIRFIGVVGGYVETIKILDDGRYAMVCQLQREPVVACRG
jgi:hypothetical protein